MILSDSDRQDNAVITRHFMCWGSLNREPVTITIKCHFGVYVVKKKILQGSVPSVCKFIAHMTQQKKNFIFLQNP